MMVSEFDVVIIGAGVLGTFHAYHATKLGKRVLLLEKDQYPIQASARTFGQIIPSSLPKAWFDEGLRSLEIYNDIQNEVDISVVKNGSVYVASDTDERRLIHELKATMDNRGYRSELMSTRRCMERWPALKSGYCKEALYFPTELSISPAKMIPSVLLYLQKKNSLFTYRSSSTVVECSVSGNQVKVVTSSGESFRADKAIICNGHEFKLLFNTLFKKSNIRVCKLHMARTVPMPEVKFKGNILTGLSIRRYQSFAECPSFSHIRVPDHLAELTKLGIHIILKKTDDDTIILGDSHEYSKVDQSDDLGFSINQHIIELILAEASRIANFNVRYISSSWTGSYAESTDGIFEYDLEDRIHIRTAIGSKGMTTGPGYAASSIDKIFDTGATARPPEKFAGALAGYTQSL